MVPVAVQGASRRMASKSASGLHTAASATTKSAAKPRRARFSRDARHAGGRGVDCGDLGSGADQGGGLAARCGAEIGDPFARHIAEKADGQRGRGVLNPPRALRESRHRVDGAAFNGTDRAGRQGNAAEPFRPACGVVLDGNVEVGLHAMGGGDPLGGIVAEIRPPARHQPWRACRHPLVRPRGARRVRASIVGGRR